MSVNVPADRMTAGNYPFMSAGTESELYPPVCLRSHWDPTKMLKLILPEQGKGPSLPLPMDFRPYVKVCKDYVTSAPAVEAPLPPAGVVFPMGGEFYPPGRYSQSIDRESILERLDRPLDRWCQVREYIPSTASDMYVPNALVPRTGKPSTLFVQELAMPQSLLREEPYACRSADDKVLWERSPRLFNNPTKQDRYGAQKYSALPGGITPMPHGEAQRVPLTAQAIAGSFTIPRPGGDGVSHERAYQGIRPVYDQPQDRVRPLKIVGITTAGLQAPA